MDWRLGFHLLLIDVRLDGMVPNTPIPQRSANGATKRKAAFDTPAIPKFNKAEAMSSPNVARTNGNTNSVKSVADHARARVVWLLTNCQEYCIFRTSERRPNCRNPQSALECLRGSNRAPS